MLTRGQPVRLVFASTIARDTVEGTFNMTTNIGVARLWIDARLGDTAKDEAKSSNGNMSFASRVAYSYTTPIAAFVADKVGRMVALVTTETYSKTTEGKHKNAVRSALLRHGGIDMFHVPFLLADAYPGQSAAMRLVRHGGYSVADQHRANLEDYDARIAAEQARLARARTYTSADHLVRLTYERARYARAFGLEA